MHLAHLSWREAASACELTADISRDRLVENADVSLPEAAVFLGKVIQLTFHAFETGSASPVVRNANEGVPGSCGPTYSIKIGVYSIPLLHHSQPCPM